jgi:transposase InsO family protein
LSELDRANTEIALLEEELSIKDVRWKRIAPRRRPYYRPVQRMRILKLKAARGWSASQTAGVFGVTQETITSWLMRVDEEGERALVQLLEPVNRFPDFVGHLVRWLKSICPMMGKVRIAQVLARAGLRLGATTVGRMLKEDEPDEGVSEVALAEEVEFAVSTRVVTANYPDHVWHIDLTVIPTSAGFWVPWFPFSLPQRWPFCWWLAVAVDHFSRRLQGFAIFVNKPCAEEVCAFLDRAAERVGARPRHIITDQGGQFISDEFAAWCRRRGVRPRKGAVGKQGSIAIVERLIRSVKRECTRQIRVPLGLEAMRRELVFYAAWYNESRPHQALGGMTPADRYDGAGRMAKSFEPRPRWPADDGAVRVKRLQLVVTFPEGRKHLPIVELKRAA